MTADPKPRRRWFRFSLRSLLIFTALVGFFMGWIVKERRQSAREREIGRERVEKGWEVAYGGPFDRDELRGQAEGQGWWRGLARQVLGERVWSIVAIGQLAPDLASLANLTSLRELSIIDSKISDISPLAKCTSLKKLGLSRTQLSDLTPLAKLENLDELYIVQCHVRDLTPLAGLKNLTKLDASDTHVTELAPLASLTKLKILSLYKTQVTRQQVNALEKALPDCMILHGPFP